MPADRRVRVGRIVGLHGVQGWVKLESYTQPRTRIFDYRPWLLSSASGETEIAAASGREQGRGVIGKLPGVDSRDAAMALVGASIEIRRSTLPKAQPGEVYWADLEGLEAMTPNGVALGTVSHLFATGANDVLVVRDGKRERLIPFVRGEVVQTIDLDRGRIVLDWDPDF